MRHHPSRRPPCLAALFLALLLSAAQVRGQDDLQPGDVAVVGRDRAEFGLRGRDYEPLSVGTPFRVTDVRGIWIGGSAIASPDSRRGWVDRKCLREIAGTGGLPERAVEIALALQPLMRAGVRVQLDGANHVYSLDGTSSKVTDSELADCRQFEQLVAADFSETEVGDAGLARLVETGSLERLYLENTRVTEAGLAALGRLTRLEVLVIAGCRIPGSALQNLAGLRTLRTLNVGRCEVTDDELRHLSGLTNLEVLVLSDTALTGAGLAHLKPLDRLRVLNLSKTAIRDDCLVQLEGAPSLRMLYVRETSLTTAATDKLDDTLRSCSIYY